LTRGLAWTRLEAAHISNKDWAKKSPQEELGGQTPLRWDDFFLVAADKLETICRRDLEPTQATGLGGARLLHIKCTGGAGILFQGPTALARLDLANGSARWFPARTA